MVKFSKKIKKEVISDPEKVKNKLDYPAQNKKDNKNVGNGKRAPILDDLSEQDMNSDESLSDSFCGTGTNVESSEYEELDEDDECEDEDEVDENERKNKCEDEEADEIEDEDDCSEKDSAECEINEQNETKSDDQMSNDDDEIENDNQTSDGDETEPKKLSQRFF